MRSILALPWRPRKRKREMRRSSGKRLRNRGLRFARSLLHWLRRLLFEPLLFEATPSQVCGSWHSMTSTRRVARNCSELRFRSSRTSGKIAATLESVRHSGQLREEKHFELTAKHRKERLLKTLRETFRDSVPSCVSGSCFTSRPSLGDVEDSCPMRGKAG